MFLVLLVIAPSFQGLRPPTNLRLFKPFAATDFFGTYSGKTVFKSRPQVKLIQFSGILDVIFWSVRCRTFKLRIRRSA